MGRPRTEHYYMSEDEKREYRRLKLREFRERKASLAGYAIKHHDPDSHPSKMSYADRLAYNREHLRKHLAKNN